MFDPVLSPREILAEGFARRLVRWARDMQPDFAGAEWLEKAARQVSLDTANGHVCTDIRALPGVDIAVLRDSGVVASSEADRALPLVLDDEGRLYLHRYFDYERRLAKALQQMALDRPPLREPSPEVRKRLNAVFTAPGADWRKIAAGMALLGRLTIVSGGPGRRGPGNSKAPSPHAPCPWPRLYAAGVAGVLPAARRLNTRSIRVSRSS